MSEVYVVEHRTMGRRAVAKVLHGRFAGEERRRLADRMRVEAQALGRLHHAHIVSILALTQTSDGRPCIVTEYLEGRTLADELAERGRLPVLEAVRYACQLLAALEAAHGLGLVHRDIKPANLFLCTGADGQGCLKVLDFGVVRVLPSAPEHAPKPVSVPTDQGVVVGTPRYVSPEAVMGQAADARSDLYAAGLVLYKMVAGRGPFDHINSDDLLLTAHALEDPAPPSSVAGTPVPPELDHLTLRALAKDPATRFQTAHEFSRALEALASLLISPQGWADTSLFDPESRSSPPTRGLPVAEPDFGRSAPTAQKHETPSPQRGGGPRELPRSTLLTAFLLAVLGTVAVLGLILALVQSLK